MRRDNERIERNRQELRDVHLDGFVCTLPMNVLLLTGYWPVIGNSIAVLSADEKVTLIVPEDEQELANDAWADEVVTFQAGSLKSLSNLADVLHKPLSQALAELNASHAKIGLERGPIVTPVPYVSINLFGCGLTDLSKNAAPNISTCPAEDSFSRLTSTLTAQEVEMVKNACAVAESAFKDGSRHLRSGITEREVATLFRAELGTPNERISCKRADGHTFCMSGANAYHAFAAYQISTARRLQPDDPALVHCNSYIDGFWTDITRTYAIGEPDEEKRRIYEAIFTASSAAISAIRPGVEARAVDFAAREVLGGAGYGKYFVHGLGHAVGFHAIDHNAQPRIHPTSPDRLESGMVFNIEPAVYIENYGGFRHCDMVVVTDDGAEILTNFQRSVEELTIT